MDSPSNSLIGQFFLTFDSDGRLKCQGEIVGCPEPGFFMCQFFSALTGHETNCEIARISDMQSWKFYASADDWRAAYVSFHRSHWQ